MASVMSHVQLESALKQQRPGLPVSRCRGRRPSAGFCARRYQARDALAVKGTNSITSCSMEMTRAELIFVNSVGWPVFAERRLVVVKAAEKLNARESDLLLDCVKNPIESTTLVFVSPKLDGRLKFSQPLHERRSRSIVHLSATRSCLPGSPVNQNGSGFAWRMTAPRCCKSLVGHHSMACGVNWRSWLRMCRLIVSSPPPMFICCAAWIPASQCLI